MKKLLIAAAAVFPLLLSSCVDRFGAGHGETERFYADGHVRNPYYGRKYYYDPHSPHDAHARQRDGRGLPGSYDSRYYAYDNPYYPTAYLRRRWYYDPNSIHDAYARPRGPYRRNYGVNPAYNYSANPAYNY